MAATVSVGRKVRLLREMHGMPQGLLAKKLGLKQAVMSHIECGRRDPSYRELQEIARVFNTSPDYFFEGGKLDELYAKDLRQGMAKARTPAPPAEAATRPVPLFHLEGGHTIRFDDAGMPTGKPDEIEYLRRESVTEGLFGGILHGDSMEQSVAPSFREGDRLFFDPARRVTSGAFAFVRTADTVTFKQVFFDDERRVRLHPLNPHYPEATVERRNVIVMWPLVARFQRF